MAMESNNFWYQNNYYVQMKGMAMGARYAPNVANVFMRRSYIVNHDPS